MQWGAAKKVRYTKLDNIVLLDMEKEDDAFADSSSSAPNTAFVPLSESGIEPGIEGADRDDAIDGYGDFEAVGVDNTALALAKCEKYVLKPYKFILKILGWMSFVESPKTSHRLCRMAVIALWTLVIVIAMVTQIMSCFRRDSFLPGTVVTMNSSNLVNSCSEVREIQCENHVISAFILTDILLLSSYFFGVYLFSRDEAEYLSKLADQVFIKSNKAGQNSAANWLVGTIVLYFLCGIVWVVLSSVVRIMTTFSVQMWSSCTLITWPENVRFEGAGKNALVVLDLIGFVSFDIVYVAAVMNYAAQSEMNIFLLRAVRKIVEDKRYGNTQLDSSIKDILECRKYIHVLNGKTATATALIMFNLGSAGLVAIVSLNDIRFEQARRPTLTNVELATVAAAFNVVLWITLVSFPFIQAARVTDACLHVKASGPEVRARPQLYSSSPQLELDSFVSLTEAVRLRATIFGIPIYPWMWWVVFTGISFTALILFQTGVYSFTIYL